MKKPVLDVCCGSKMFYFDKKDERVLFCDIRDEEMQLCDGRTLTINPDKVMDFTKLDISDSSHKLVVFDPPHLIKVGDTSWLAKKYGKLKPSWKQEIKKGFSECFRVLEIGGVLIFKWNETDIMLSTILELTDQKPIFGHRSGKRMNTHWVTFIK